MHRSRLYLIVIDVNDLERGTEFWKQALGATVDPSADNDLSRYRRLSIPGKDVRVLLQLVPETKTVKNRAHVDIATDDVEAEVERLVRIGATKLRPFPGIGMDFWVLADPFGNEFCVVTPEHQNILDDANTWD